MCFLLWIIESFVAVGYGFTWCILSCKVHRMSSTDHFSAVYEKVRVALIFLMASFARHCFYRSYYEMASRRLRETKFCG
jgi:hypothetical protein